MTAMNSVIDTLNNILWGWLLIVVLVGSGIYFTVRLKLVQFASFPKLFSALKGSRSSASGSGITSFEAFATSLAARVGTGNIAGVAVAITLGGPGSIFWMWVVALLGMATAMVEATLAQVFKHRDQEGLFRGGPAYYMERGLGMRWMGILFSILLLIAYGLVFNTVQSNAIAEAVDSAFDVPHWLTAAVICVLTLVVISGGLRRVSKTAEYLVPFMAFMYVGMVLAVVAMNITEVPDVLLSIVRHAFGLEEAVGGAAGYGIALAMRNGIKRGLFSNEAGLGSAPNAAATAEVSHPARQGFVQALGVFFDTIIICTATAFLILLSDAYTPGQKASGVTLTQESLAGEVGSWGKGFVAVALILFAFSTIIANYSFGETNLHYLIKDKTRQTIAVWSLRGITGLMIVAGVYANLSTVWNAADVALGLMALVNLAALVMLANVAVPVIRDYVHQLKTTDNPIYDPSDSPDLVAKLEPGIWPATASDRV